MGVERPTHCFTCGDPLIVNTVGRVKRFCSDKCRKISYGGTCVDCGTRTDGSNGPESAPERCAPCAGRHAAVWSSERVVAAIQQWARENGHPPTAAAFRLAPADLRRLPRLRGLVKDRERFPSLGVVEHHFGSWNKALEAAGFTPHREFDTPTRDRPGLVAEVASRYAKGESVVSMAADFGVSISAVYHWLDRAGVSRRAA